MKRTTAALFAAAALTLAACGTPTIVVQSPTTPAASTPAAAPAEAPSTPRADFLAFIDERVGYTGSSDADLVAGAESVCDFLDAGGTPVEVVAMAASSAGDSDAAQDVIAAVVAGAVTFICPRHLDAMQGAVGGAR